MAKRLVIDKVKGGFPQLGLISSKEPTHMVAGIISPCDKCSREGCPRDYERIIHYWEFDMDFYRIMAKYKGRPNLYPDTFNPICLSESQDNLLDGMVFAFVALAHKNMGLTKHGEVLYTWEEEESPRIICEPFPVPCIFWRSILNATFSWCHTQRSWVRILYTGDFVHNGVFIPSVGSYKEMQSKGTIISDWEVGTF